MTSKTINHIFIHDRKLPMTKEEAKKMLINCGILNENGDIEDAYKDILYQIPESKESE